eukprot:CAMPEP_0183332276 /NCGR_PEP_ID=MMETSP0164_2-20130417/1506_1 /TAXON_ID=221442 /ORGANISM="Coccolithus pelagicus ssp braarudi, Strain PLY182g" /LENGTH=129 /DNA_ID=CAMNT_0025500975 /DNA_START=430 /DNA_END=820 /DNA_ORIENTATION=+
MKRERDALIREALNHECLAIAGCDGGSHPLLGHMGAPCWAPPGWRATSPRKLQSWANHGRDILVDDDDSNIFVVSEAVESLLDLRRMRHDLCVDDEKVGRTPRVNITHASEQHARHGVLISNDRDERIV